MTDSSSSVESYSSSSESYESSSETSSLKRQRTSTSTTMISSGGTDEKKKLTATLIDLDVIDCSVCFDTLTIPISQCVNGHIVCSTCCTKLKKKCATCSLPILSRNRAMERVLELLRFPCSNAEFGCSEEVIYDERSAHLERCAFAPCTCPFTSCSFTGSYMDLYEHSVDKHLKSLSMFECGNHVYIHLKGGEKVVLKEKTTDERSGGGELVVVECFDTPYARIISVSSIAPNVPGIGLFSYNLKLDSSHCDRLCFGSKVKRVCEVSGELPITHFTLIPLYVCPEYKLKISITRRAY
ncbi:unnamed protein product [Arabis nemorensis]|uniref:RING-type E3 ubiquitin transferase n=1 Tax=Arabis nemorensis TaxID=586526 RepID=A0A565BWQ6_9BRAS|nr:unnamed protein product [Arabis nemorensis]